MPVGSTEPGGEKCLDEVPGQLCPDGAPTEAEHVHVVVFHTLAGREVILDQAARTP